ncbi:hypothetical protein BD626DRAFT_384135, partial [Schizophyllum amplum]
SFKLKAVIYHGSDHFTMRIWKGHTDIWTYDGMDEDGAFVYEGKSSSVRRLRRLGSRTAVAAMYTSI